MPRGLAPKYYPRLHIVIRTYSWAAWRAQDVAADTAAISVCVLTGETNVRGDAA
jgi:hypothetical protein